MDSDSSQGRDDERDPHVPPSRRDVQSFLKGKQPRHSVLGSGDDIDKYHHHHYLANYHDKHARKYHNHGYFHHHHGRFVNDHIEHVHEYHGSHDHHLDNSDDHLYGPSDHEHGSVDDYNQYNAAHINDIKRSGYYVKLVNHPFVNDHNDKRPR